MKGTRPLNNNEIRNLVLESGLNFRWQYTFDSKQREDREPHSQNT